MATYFRLSEFACGGMSPVATSFVAANYFIFYVRVQWAQQLNVGKLGDVAVATSNHNPSLIQMMSTVI